MSRPPPGTAPPSSRWPRGYREGRQLRFAAAYVRAPAPSASLPVRPATCRVPRGWPVPRAALLGWQPWAPWCPARPLDKAAGTLSTEPLFAREHVSSKRARSRGFPTAGPAREQSCCRAAPPRLSLHQQSMRARRSARLMERRARLPHHTRSRAHFVGGALPGFLVDKSPLSLPACNRRVDGYPSPGLWEL